MPRNLKQVNGDFALGRRGPTKTTSPNALTGSEQSGWKEVESTYALAIASPLYGSSQDFTASMLGHKR